MNSKTSAAEPVLITSIRSPNFDDRTSKVRYLIQHYTGMESAQAAINRLCDPVAKVSSHYVVVEDGKTYQIVAEDKRAWHAGVSYWGGTQQLNDSSIGIEIVNRGDQPFPAVQMEAVKQLSLWILSRYDIGRRHVLGHSDIAPGRKHDPGPLFDWQGLAAAGIGIWPAPTPQDDARAKYWSAATFHRALLRYGYSPSVDATTVITAFQEHFQPEAFKGQGTVGVPNRQAKARLAWLLRQS